MRISFFLSGLFTSLCSAQIKPCYSFSGPNRVVISQIPCDPSANVSACCAPGASCETNFYCHGAGAGDTFNRVGGCTDESGYDPACPFPFLRDPSVWNWFSYRANTTDCGDGTYCMHPGNETCCYNGQGVKEITYHNNATIPTAAAEWSAYYQDGGYSIPIATPTPSSSSSTLLALGTTSAVTALPTSPTQTRQLTVPTPPASPTSSTNSSPTSPSNRTAISSSEKAIIGTSSALGVVLALCSLYLFRRLRAQRSAHRTSSSRTPNALYAYPGGGENNGARHAVAPSEMDTGLGWFAVKAHRGGIHEIMGRDEGGQRAEMSG